MNPVWWKVRRPSGTTNSAIYFDPYLIPKVFIYLIFKGILDSVSENRNNHEKQLPEHHWLIHSVRGAGADRLQHRVLQHHGKARVREARYPGRPGRECPGCPDRCPGNLPLVTGTVPECGGHSRYRTEGQVRRNPRCLSRQRRCCRV